MPLLLPLRLLIIFTFSCVNDWCWMTNPFAWLLFPSLSLCYSSSSRAREKLSILCFFLLALFHSNADSRSREEINCLSVSLPRSPSLYLSFAWKRAFAPVSSSSAENGEASNNNRDKPFYCKETYSSLESLIESLRWTMWDEQIVIMITNVFCLLLLLVKIETISMMWWCARLVSTAMLLSLSLSRSLFLCRSSIRSFPSIQK